MDKKLIEEILDELIPTFEAMEAQSAAVLMFLKDKELATDYQLAPYLRQAADASNVRWRATRVRMERLLSAAMKESVAVKEEKQEVKPKEAKAEEEPEQKTEEKPSRPDHATLAQQGTKPVEREKEHEAVPAAAAKDKDNNPAKSEGERKDAA